MSEKKGMRYGFGRIVVGMLDKVFGKYIPKTEVYQDMEREHMSVKGDLFLKFGQTIEERDSIQGKYDALEERLGDVSGDLRKLSEDYGTTGEELEMIRGDRDGLVERLGDCSSERVEELEREAQNCQRVIGQTKSALSNFQAWKKGYRENILNNAVSFIESIGGDEGILFILNGCGDIFYQSEEAVKQYGDLNGKRGHEIISGGAKEKREVVKKINKFAISNRKAVAKVFTSIGGSEEKAYVSVIPLLAIESVKDGEGNFRLEEQRYGSIVGIEVPGSFKSFFSRAPKTDFSQEDYRKKLEIEKHIAESRKGKEDSE